MSFITFKINYLIIIMGINLKKNVKNHLTKTKLSICWQNGKLITDYDGNKKFKKKLCESKLREEQFR